MAEFLSVSAPQESDKDLQEYLDAVRRYLWSKGYNLTVTAAGAKTIDTTTLANQKFRSQAPNLPPEKGGPEFRTKVVEPQERVTVKCGTLEIDCLHPGDIINAITIKLDGRDITKEHRIRAVTLRFDVNEATKLAIEHIVW